MDNSELDSLLFFEEDLGEESFRSIQNEQFVELQDLADQSAAQVSAIAQKSDVVADDESVSMYGPQRQNNKRKQPAVRGVQLNQQSGDLIIQSSSSEMVVHGKIIHFISYYSHCFTDYIVHRQQICWCCRKKESCCPEINCCQQINSWSSIIAQQQHQQQSCFVGCW